MNRPAKLRIIVADDEPLARARLKLLLSEVDSPRCEVVAECADAASVAQALEAVGAAEPVDGVLLDIQMPGGDGLSLAQQLKAQSRRLSDPAIVFVTAHPDRALEAFDVDAADYLTKPVRRDRLQAALERVQKRAAQRVAQQRADEALLQASSQTPNTAAVLVASERGRVARIAVQDVLYLRAELKYVTLRTAERAWTLDESLTELESRLGDTHRFLRVHRNAVVAIDAIDAFDKRPLVGDDEVGETWAVHVAATDEWLAVSRRQLAAVRDAVDARTLMG